MKTNTLHYLIIFIFLFEFCVISVFSQDSYPQIWKLSKEKNEIKIYTRNITDSEILEVKAITTIKTSTPSLLKIINDVSSYHMWMSNIKTAKILKTINENEKIIYHELKVPWPFDNRDFVMNYKLIDNPSTNSVSILLSNYPDYIEEKPYIIRIRKARGLLKFELKENDEVEIQYQFYADPEMFVPSWLINLIIVEGPYNTLDNLRQLL